MLQAFVPLKGLEQAKSRLAETLPDPQRRSLVEAMAQDTVSAILGCDDVSRLTVIGPASWEDRLPAVPRLQFLREERFPVTGLNSLLSAAVSAERPALALVVHGDLPWLTAADIRCATRSLGEGNLVLCPDSAGVGTNALAFPRSLAPAFQFGPDSFAAHRRDARGHCRPCLELRRPGFSRDIDTPADLYRLLEDDGGVAPGPRTGAWVERHGTALLSRLRQQPAVGRIGAKPSLRGSDGARSEWGIAP